VVDDLWDAYADAIIEYEIDGRPRCMRGPDAGALPAEPPVFVVTAFNPGGVERARAANDADEARLEQELAAAGMTFWPADGRSRDRSWWEPGVAIVGVDRDAACSLGHRFGQLAVYEIVDDEVRVVRCTNGEVVRARPRAE
jgi:hypothetical protein